MSAWELSGASLGFMAGVETQVKSRVDILTTVLSGSFATVATHNQAAARPMGCLAARQPEKIFWRNCLFGQGGKVFNLYLSGDVVRPQLQTLRFRAVRSLLF